MSVFDEGLPPIAINLSPFGFNFSALPYLSALSGLLLLYLP